MRRPVFVTRGSAPEQFAGAGALRAAVDASELRRPLLFVDARVVDAAEAVLAMVPDLTRAARIIVDAPIEWDDVERFTEKIRDYAAESIIAIGGGNAMDAAKLAGWAAFEPSGIRPLLSRSRIGGLVSVPHAVSALPVVCAPTTVGTGAEVSAVACCTVRIGADEHKCLMGFGRSPVVAAAYEPELLRGPRGLVLAGIAEAWLRPLGAFVGAPSATRTADTEALALLQRISTLVTRILEGGEIGDPELLEIALASAASHTGWALRGRGIAPSALWFAANELSMMAAVTKMEATSALLAGWVAAVSSGDTRWGDGQRLARALEASRCTSIEEFADRVHALVTVSPLAFDATALGERVASRFGGGRPLRRDLTAAAFAGLAESIEHRALSHAAG